VNHNIDKEPVRDATLRDLPECPTCRAGRGDPCRSLADRTIRPHRGREQVHAATTKPLAALAEVSEAGTMTGPSYICPACFGTGKPASTAEGSVCWTCNGKGFVWPP